MKTYRISLPPRTPGIYLLKNPVDRLVYVGQSENLYRRFCEWRSAFHNGYGIKSKLIYEAIKGTDLDDWEFCILKELPGASKASLDAEEASAISSLESGGVSTLNTIPVVRSVTARRGIPQSVVVTHEGNPVTYRQAAEILGCSMKTISKRAARYKAKGYEEVRLEDWQDVTRKYRAP